MSRLNKLLIQQPDIFLAPGSYFHREFNGVVYQTLPAVLQKKHNLQLIQQYALPLPDEKTLLLPKVLANHWVLLPKVALALGVVMHPEPLPWWGQLPQYDTLRSRLGYSPKQTEMETLSPELAPQTLLALGAAQVLSCLMPFGSAYIERAQYMFSRTTQQLITTSDKTMLPWNIIEETCHYVRENNPRERTTDA